MDRNGLVATAAVHLGDGRHRRAGLIAEVEHVPLADQPEADEAQADSIICPEDPTIRPGRQGRGGAASQKRTPAQRGELVSGWLHHFVLPGATRLAPFLSVESPIAAPSVPQEGRTSSPYCGGPGQATAPSRSGSHTSNLPRIRTIPLPLLVIDGIQMQYA